LTLYNMNLERFMSTVYTELIIKDKEDYYAKLDKYLNELFTNLKYIDIRDSYITDLKPYETKQPVVDYMLHNLLFEKVLQNTFRYLQSTHKNTILLFPVYHDTESKNRLKKSLDSIYRPILSLKKPNEFIRDPSGTTVGNSIMFIPLYSDAAETMDEYSERLTEYLNRWYNYIVDEKPIPNETRKREHTKFDTICYTVDKNGDLFTNYYSKKLKPDKAKRANELLNTFLEKLGLSARSTIKDPILQLTPEIATRKFKDDGQKDTEKLELFLEFIKVFLDIYKRTNDKDYLKSSSASDNQDILRIYYRISRTDDVDVYDSIKTGSTYVYRLEDTRGISRIGYFIDKNKKLSQYLFREYKGLTSQYQTEKSKGIVINPNDNDIVINEEVDEEDIGEEFIIKPTTLTDGIHYKKIKRGRYENTYDGTIELFMDLHIYEKYKWFDFKDMGGQFASNTEIKFQEDILFDIPSLKKFLKEKKMLTPETKLNQEFLKINQDSALLLDYVEFISKDEYFKKKNMYNKDKGELKDFKANTISEILKILFQTNSLIYTTRAHSETEKTDITKNYKMVTYQSFEPSENHFNQKLYEMKESKYCGKKNECELIKELAKKNNENYNYALVIVDVTKDNVEVDSSLKSKTYCKKVRRTLKRQLYPFLKKLLPAFGGSRKKRKSRRLIARSRKYTH
jgi:hypothetical protein